MIEVIPFHPSHIQELREQEATRHLAAYLSPEMEQHLTNQKWAFTAKIRGRVVMCGGIVEAWRGRGVAWSIIDQRCHFDFVPIHRAVKNFLAICPLRRIEAEVSIGFRNGHRWMRMLGFKKEAERMRAYLPTGEDATLYALVKEGV